MPFLILAGGLAVVLGFGAWPARIRRRGLAGGAMSAAPTSYEEAFRVTAHEAHVEIRARAERTAPVLSPDGHWGRSAAEGRRAELRRKARRGSRGLGRAVAGWIGRAGRGRRP
ncbi:hypothetical protein ACFWR9_09725 [Streptomyces sp. NPDC058534]|uniref:hypothetical protein n=1 Tax=Streptomyces sp. NPDC058534 TaxID=3346541 RepID=UPI003658BD84